MPREGLATARASCATGLDRRASPGCKLNPCSLDDLPDLAGAPGSGRATPTLAESLEVARLRGWRSNRSPAFSSEADPFSCRPLGRPAPPSLDRRRAVGCPGKARRVLALGPQGVSCQTWPASVLFWPPRTDLQVRAQKGLSAGGPAARVGRSTVARSEPYAKKTFGAAGRDQNNTQAGQFMSCPARGPGTARGAGQLP